MSTGLWNGFVTDQLADDARFGLWHQYDTAVGHVDATALEELEEKFDIHELLELVDALDEWRGRIDGRSSQ